MTVKITGPVRGAVEGACGHPIDIDFAVELLQELVDDGGMSEFDVIAKLSAARSSDALASLHIDGGATTVYRKVGTPRGH